MLLLLLFPELSESLGDAKWFAENAFPIWAIQDSLLSLGIYDWRVRSDFAGVFDMIGNLYRYGVSFAIQGQLILFGYRLLKESSHRMRSLVRLILTLPLVVIAFEVVMAFFVSYVFTLSVLIDHIGYIAAFLCLFFLATPVLALLFAAVVGILYYLMRKIWVNERSV